MVVPSLVLSCSNPDRIDDNVTDVEVSDVSPLALSRLQLEAQQATQQGAAAQAAQKNAEHLVRSALKIALFDPESARLAEVRIGRAGTVCGKVNAKNRYGAYVGYKDFVLSRDHETVYISVSNDGLQSTLYGSFAEAYLTACASKVEAAKHAEATAPHDVDEGPTFELPEEEPDAILDAPPEDEGTQKGTPSNADELT